MAEVSATWSKNRLEETRLKRLHSQIWPSLLGIYQSIQKSHPP